MPKRYATRPIAQRGEANLARRVEQLRRDRRWSYETLAKEMTQVGCTMSKAALYSIEQGDPPRRITVDELLGFAAVFTDGDVPELLKPPELVEQERARELLETLQLNERNLMVMASDVLNVLVDLTLMKGKNPEVYEFVMSNWFHNPRGLPQADRAALSDGETLHEQAVARAAREVREMWILGLLRAANLWIVATTDDGLNESESEDVKQALASEEPWIERKGWLFEPGEAKD